MERMLVASGAAVVAAHENGRQWSIGNGVVRKTLVWQEGAGLCCTALEHLTTGHIWRAQTHAHAWAGGEFSLQWNAVRLSARQATVLQDVRAFSDDAAVTLQIDLRIAEMLEISLYWRTRADTAVIEQWLTVTPRQPGVLSRVAPLTLSVAASAPLTLHWVRGLQGHGAGMPEHGPYPAFQVNHTPLGVMTIESGLRSTWHAIAWFALDEHTGGDGLFSGLRYSGRWSATAAATTAATTAATAAAGATLDLYSEGFATPLDAGACWTSPVSFLGVYAGDLDAAAHVQHNYLRAAVIPPTPPDFPWVQYNTWFAHLVDIDESILRREAELAARLGAEVFVIDAGWWAPSRRTSDNFTTGLGVWQPSAEKFPSGIRVFADYVRSLGMRFGIWVEPERVDLRQPATWQLSWLVRHHDAIVSPPWPPDTVSGWLCFGHQDVQAWAIEWISRLVSEVKAEWLKWDSNWWGVCTCANHGHSVSDGEWHQVDGVHRVIAELRRRFPALIVENCAGGGTRTDFAMLANTHITWLHDASTPSRRVRFHLAGAHYLFPPELGNTWVVDADDEPLTDPATSRAALDEIARSRMFGAYGVSARLPAWTDAAFAAVRESIAQYKRLRPLLKRGHFYHLLPQTTLLCRDLALHGQWEAYAVIDDETGEGAIWLFRAAEGPPAQRVHLRGLRSERTYTLADVDTSHILRAAGASLMADGFAADLHNRTSALLLLQSA